MVHHWPPDETDLHEFGNSTMCPCGCELDFDEGGGMVVMHKSFEVSALLAEAAAIMNGTKHVTLLPFARRKK